ncbi:hypothetical protein YC2023_091162 [Brassica napus]
MVSKENSGFIFDIIEPRNKKMNQARKRWAKPSTKTTAQQTKRAILIPQLDLNHPTQLERNPRDQTRWARPPRKSIILLVDTCCNHRRRGYTRREILLSPPLLVIAGDSPSDHPSQTGTPSFRQTFTSALLWDSRNWRESIAVARSHPPP